MGRIVTLFFIVLFYSCNGNNNTEEESTVAENGFENKFKLQTVPYSLTDTALLENKDTTVLRSENFQALIPDSIKQKIFNRTNRITYTPLAKIQAPKAETYFIVKATSGSKKAAILITLDKDHQLGAVMPFLVPDGISNSAQVSSIDKAYSIYRSVIQKKPNNVMYEGKEVYIYNNDAKQFTLIMTDVLDDSKAEIINPIDTFGVAHKYAGDYTKGKRDIVSIRDGRKPNTVAFFIHFEKNNGKCIGELKGEAEFQSANTAFYRQAGDPCVLKIDFSKNSVSLAEEEGCGLHRDLECAFEGSYTKSKPSKTKK